MDSQGRLFEELPPYRRPAACQRGRDRRFLAADFAARKVARHLVKRLLQRLADELELNRGVLAIVYSTAFEPQPAELDCLAALDQIRWAEAEARGKRNRKHHPEP